MASARPFSLIETAKANQIEPYRIFTKLPQAQSIEDCELLPSRNWLKTASVPVMLKKASA